ncbi:MAG: class I SAM-dependent rRNA methyltransferase [Acidimicrobiia bacterium]|nr:MAG: class I SAM-dependent rRNA methyltransferase [Acidimicrobiia bacterium]
MFDGGIESVRGGRHGDGTGDPGDVAVIFDERRRFVAVGLWDPRSPIRIKVLHAASPVTVDADLWHDRLAHALAHRWELLGSADTDALRIVHGENDRLPGLVLDLYGTVAVLKLYSAAWVPHLDEVLGVIRSTIWSIDGIVLRLARSVAADPTVREADLADGAVLHGVVPDRLVEFREHGLRFTADVRRGQKTGWFLDQRDNRDRVRALADGATVLDVFCCGGGFSVHAAAGGARHVHSVDRSPHAIDDTVRHLSMNRDVPGVAAVDARQTVGDAFEVMDDLRRSGDRYDLVIVDPPSFASRRSDVRGALQAYAALTTRAVELVVPGGILVQASCSSRVHPDDFTTIVEKAAGRAGVHLEVFDRTAQPIDHPVGFPEGRYLKAVYARVNP